MMSLLLLITNRDVLRKVFGKCLVQIDSLNEARLFVKILPHFPCHCCINCFQLCVYECTLFSLFLIYLVFFSKKRCFNNDFFSSSSSPLLFFITQHSAFSICFCLTILCLSHGTKTKPHINANQVKDK